MPGPEQLAAQRQADGRRGGGELGVVSGNLCLHVVCDVTLGEGRLAQHLEEEGQDRREPPGWRLPAQGGVALPRSAVQRGALVFQQFADAAVGMDEGALVDCVKGDGGHSLAVSRLTRQRRPEDHLERGDVLPRQVEVPHSEPGRERAD